MNHLSFFLRSLRVTLIAAGLVLGAASTAVAAGVLDKARETGKLTFGYRADARPFAYTDAGKPAGFSVALCQKVADAVKAELNLPNLQIEFVPVTATSRFELLQQGRIDLSCGTDTPTLARRANFDFSLPIFLAGTGAVMRIDGDRRVQDVLAGRAEPAKPLWRGNPGELGQNVTAAVVGGTTVEASLLEALRRRRVEVNVVKVPDYAAGIQMVLDRSAVVLFGDRPVLLDLAQRGPGAGQLLVIERRFTREPFALALPRGDSDLRLLVDRTLSRLYRSPEIATLYTTYFGAPGALAKEFFQTVALPE
jgi:polar amino acid transport system substrate-binding protein